MKMSTKPGLREGHRFSDMSKVFVLYVSLMFISFAEDAMVCTAAGTAGTAGGTWRRFLVLTSLNVVVLCLMYTHTDYVIGKNIHKDPCWRMRSPMGADQYTQTLSIYLSIYLSFYQPISISIYLYLSNYLSFHPSIHPSIHLSIHLSNCNCKFTKYHFISYLLL